MRVRGEPSLSYMMAHIIVLIVINPNLSGIVRRCYMRENDGYHPIRDFKDRPVKGLYDSISDMGVGESFKYPLDTVRLCQ